jgi:hypothetical protein
MWASMETGRTEVFHDPVRGREFFETVIDEACLAASTEKT